MNSEEFLAFINASGTRGGGATFNIKSVNVSKAAREILAGTEYKALAKQHINNSIKQAYYNNAKFKQALDDVMAKYNITVIS